MAEENTHEEHGADVKTQADTPPAVENPKAEKSNKGARWPRFKIWYVERKKWTIPATVLLFILLLAAVPFTRYNLAGLVLKKNYTIQVSDSTAGTPVSGATVSLGSVSAETDGSGKAVLHHIKVGHHKVLLSKKYYEDRTVSLVTPILSQKSVPNVEIVATGRQVKVTVTNLITKSALQNVSIKIAGTTAKTDKNGTAIVVLPVGANVQKATLSLSGYNDAQVTVKINSDTIQNNPFTLTPAGKVYFLSKLSGKIDVVKTNLDGTERQTVLAGTGKEDDQNTVLLASRDWKYLALLSKRAGGNSPSIYLIDTSDDSLSTIDEGNADFNPVGWLDDNFVYSVTRNDVQFWQANQQAVKSFNAPTKKLTTLDQTTAGGSSQYSYIAQQLGSIYAYNGLIYYIMNWTSSNNSDFGGDLSTKQATFNSIKPDGSAKKAIKSFSLSSGAAVYSITVNEQIEKPDLIHFYFNDGSNDIFYVYTNGQVKTDPNINSTSDFYGAAYSTYLQSPSDNNTFWSEPRDGKNTLFIGDEDGNNGKQIATLSDYNTYGWYTDNYLLVSKDSSELYIMDKSGKQDAVKISDYHKPARTFNGYGGGYGGGF